MAKHFDYKNINIHFDNCKQALNSAIVELALIQPVIVSVREGFVACGNDEQAERLINDTFQSTSMLHSKARLIQQAFARAEKCAMAARDDFWSQSANSTGG